MDISISYIAAVLSTILLVGLGIFQIAIAAGLPYGEYAWGGQHKVLPGGLRIGSIASVGIYALMALVLWDASSLVEVFPAGLIKDYGIWVLVAYFVIGVVVNAISRSKKERYTMTPTVTILLLCSLAIAGGI